MRSPTEAPERAAQPDAAAAPPSGLLPRLLDAGLALVAVAGLLSAAWFIASSLFGLGLVAFATGSMAPAYPTGSIAVSAPVALRDVRVGDVVTVDRDGGRMPITHRVRSIAVSPDGTAARLVLRGDANRFDDPAAYEVTAVRRVVARVPFGPELVRAAAAPIGIGVVAMLITGALFWALWPRERRAR